MTELCRMSSGPPENSVSTVRVKKNNDAQWTHSAEEKVQNINRLSLFEFLFDSCAAFPLIFDF